MKGRGTEDKPDGRFLTHTRQTVDDGWLSDDSDNKIHTEVIIEKPKTIIARNQSPDIPFTQSINPYRGCEHGCIYCYARPTHAYFDLSPGIDFETRLFAKPNAAELLEKELASPSYQCSTIALGTNTDPYQPIDRDYKITRQIIELLRRHKHPLTIVTKSSLVERDIDLLAEMAKENLCQVFISITTLDAELMRKMEPRTTSPKRRLQALYNLTEAGIPTGVMFAPVIPFINDSEMETVLEQAAIVGVRNAGYVLIRLPHEIKDLFNDWLHKHYPLKAEHVMNRIQDSRRDNKTYDSEYYSRMVGKGVFADLIKKRFARACKEYGLNPEETIPLDKTRFIKPILSGQQQSLF